MKCVFSFITISLNLDSKNQYCRYSFFCVTSVGLKFFIVEVEKRISGSWREKPLPAMLIQQQVGPARKNCGLSPRIHPPLSPVLFFHRFPSLLYQCFLFHIKTIFDHKRKIINSNGFDESGGIFNFIRFHSKTINQADLTVMFRMSVAVNFSSLLRSCC